MKSKYIEKYRKMYEAKNGKKSDFEIQNYVESITKYFDFDTYLEIMHCIKNDVELGNKSHELIELKSELFDIANKVYFVKFYKEVSLEEKVRGEGFSFDVSIFKPLKRSVLFN